MIVSYVCTNFNNSADTVKAIESLLFNKYSKLKIIVVDNNSDAKNIEILKCLSKKFVDVDIIYNHSNIGYFSGLNVGIEYLNQNYPEIIYAIIGNNDLLFSPDFLQSIKLILHKFEKYPVISPRITTLDGVQQNPHVIEYISTFRESIYDLYHTNFLLARVLKLIAKYTGKISKRGDEDNYMVAQEIWQGHGSCYLLGPLFFSTIKQLWAPTFLFGEEFFLAKQLNDKGYTIYYEPSVQVTHADHASIGKLPGRKHWEFSKEAHMVYRKHNPIKK